MANEMLKFKKGLFENLPAVSASTVGTIFVTTDEQAMYVDVAADKRVRIGDIIKVATFNELQPPYSNEAFYYVETENALLKRVRKYKDGVAIEPAEYEWKQINSTEELTSRVTALEEAVNGLSDDLGTNDGATGTTAFTRIAALEGTVGVEAVRDSDGKVTTPSTGLHADIDALKAAVGMGADGEVEGIGATVVQLSTDVAELQKDIYGVEGQTGIKDTVAAHDEAISGHDDKIKALEEASDKHATKTYVDDTFVTKAVADPILAKVDTEGTVTEAITAAVNGEKARAEAAEKALGEDISGLSGELAKVKETADAAMTEEKVDGKITAAKGEISTEIDTDVQAALNTVAGIYATKEELGATNETVSKHAEALVILNGEDSVDGSVANAKKAGTDAQTAINEWKEAHKDDYSNAKIDELVADAKKAGTDAQATANANGEEISKINQTIETLATKEELEDLEDTLNDEIAKKINAANGMTYIGGVNGTDSNKGHKVLPTENVHVGDTYVVEDAFTHPTAGDVLPGDLFIASGDETNGVITANLDWTVVHTGYDARLEQTLGTKDNTIQLTSAVGNISNGSVAFESKKDDNDNTSSIVVEVANNTVSISMVWEDFE